MKKSPLQFILLVVTSVAKLAGVVLLVYGIAWTFVALGERKNRPPSVEAGADGVLELAATQTQIMGAGGARLNDYGNKQNIGWWDSIEQNLLWYVSVEKTQSYQVELEYALPGNLVTEIAILAGKETLLTAEVTGTGGWDRWQTVSLGTLELSKGKSEKITFAATKVVDRDRSVMNFVRLRLVPLR